MSSKRFIAAAALLATAFAAGAVRAEGWQAEGGIGTASASKSSLNHGGALSIGGAFGYRFDDTFGARLITFGVFGGNEILGLNDKPAFESFTGIQATARAALSQDVHVTGGLGAGRSNYKSSEVASQADTTDAIVSAGLQWQLGHHYAMELRADYLSQAKVTNAMLMFQIPF